MQYHDLKSSYYCAFSSILHYDVSTSLLSYHNCAFRNIPNYDPGKMNAYHLWSIHVDRRICPPSKFAGLPRSTPKTRVLSNGLIKPIFTHFLMNHMIVWLPLVADLRIQLVRIASMGNASMGNKSLKYVSQHSLYEGYYICSAISTPLFQVSGKIV